MKKAKLTFEDKVIDLDVITGSENEIGIDISKLKIKSGMITLDPGFKNTGSCESKVTFLDGENGILRYRGYSIEDLANNADFLEVSYLLIYGELPTKKKYRQLLSDIQERSVLDEDVKKILETFPRSAHPMGMLSCLTSSLVAFDPSSVDVNDEEEMYDAFLNLLAKIPILVAWVFRRRRGLPLEYGDFGQGYVENVTKMMFKMPNKKYVENKVVVNAINKLLILHADHEQNCSTSTVRIVGSSQAGLFASISSGISALWGRLHGGANQAVLEMLEAIQNNGSNISEYIKKAKDKNDSFRLMGFGHRVYKNFDPRAKIIKKAAHDVLYDLGIDDPILEIAKNLEIEASKDQYFIDRKLYPNVDFYSGIIYKALKIPNEMFTVMFALGRLPGWIAHWREMRTKKEPIGRPRQIYTGEKLREFISIDKR
ncbi:MAG: citrate synthase [Cryomorphaceae bacterium]|nr:MAG: citrate synthase [Cryomorphaceae bacterium]